MDSLDESSELSALVVDDDAWICEFIKTLVEKDGISVETLTESERFLDVYDDTLDLIFLDLMMPKVDGIEVLRLLAGKESAAAIVLISVFEENILRAARAIADGLGLRVLDTLKKPFEAEDIAATLGRFRESIDGARVGRKVSPAFSRGGTAELPSLDDLRGAIKTRASRSIFSPRSACRTELSRASNPWPAGITPRKGSFRPIISSPSPRNTA
jgi:CheY-like chemotaxis protein